MKIEGPSISLAQTQCCRTKKEDAMLFMLVTTLTPPIFFVGKTRKHIALKHHHQRLERKEETIKSK